MYDNKEFDSSFKKICPAELELENKMQSTMKQHFWTRTSQLKKDGLLLNCAIKGMDLVFP